MGRDEALPVLGLELSVTLLVREMIARTARRCQLGQAARTLLSARDSPILRPRANRMPDPVSDPAPVLTLVVPCFNEASRLDRAAFAAFAHRHGASASLLLVDDGSTDGTRSVLDALAGSCPGRIDVLVMPRNAGKAEAVRRGILHALSRGAPVVGYLDADLATPLSEALRLLETLQARPLDVVIGARVLLHGHAIDRDPARHYLGRVFGTLASAILRLRIYDTQCGAKLFRAGPALSAALAEPFLSRWAFDVELLGRLLIGAPSVPPIPTERLAEVPLQRWADVAGSKVSAAAMARALVDLARIERDLARRRRRVGAAPRAGE